MIYKCIVWRGDREFKTETLQLSFADLRLYSTLLAVLCSDSGMY